MPLITNAEHFVDYLRNRNRKNLITDNIKEKLKKWEKWHQKYINLREFDEQQFITIDYYQHQENVENLLAIEPWPYTYKKEEEAIMLKSQLLTL